MTPSCAKTEKGFDVRNIDSIYYPPTPLCCVKGIGSYNERLLAGIHSFDLLKMKFVQDSRLDVNRMSDLLHQEYHVALGSSMQIANSLLTSSFFF